MPEKVPMDRNTEEVISTPSGEAFDKAEAADLHSLNVAAQAERDRLQAEINAIRAERPALRFDRAEAGHIRAALNAAVQLGAKSREFLRHVAEAERAQVENLINTATAGPVADLARKITGTLGSYDLANSLPPRLGGRGPVAMPTGVSDPDGT
jgi:hypothetical protein